MNKLDRQRNYKRNDDIIYDGKYVEDRNDEVIYKKDYYGDWYYNENTGVLYVVSDENEYINSLNYRSVENQFIIHYSPYMYIRITSTPAYLVENVPQINTDILSFDIDSNGNFIINDMRIV